MSLLSGRKRTGAISAGMTFPEKPDLRAHYIKIICKNNVCAYMCACVCVRVCTRTCVCMVKQIPTFYGSPRCHF